MDGVIVADLAWLTLLAAPFLPILVGLVTKRFADGSVKALLLLLLSAITGVVNQAILSGGLLSKETVIAAVVAYVIAVASHYGFLKPSSITGTDGVVQRKTENVGVG